MIMLSECTSKNITIKQGNFQMHLELNQPI